MRFSHGAAVFAAAALTLALAACTDDDPETDPDGAAGGEKVIEMPDQPGSVDGYEGALDDSEITTCDAGGGSLTVEGTVANPESDDQDYRVYVSAVADGDTEGIVQVDVPGVGGGDTAEWSTEIDLDDENLECVLRVERFDAQ